MEKIRNLTCIICPRGCSLSVSLDECGGIVQISGNACKRGELYAECECTNPMRIVTSTMRCEGGAVVPVKTSNTVPRELVFDVMKAINTTLAPKSIKMGQVLIENVCNTGVDIIATAEKN